MVKLLPLPDLDEFLDSDMAGSRKEVIDRKKQASGHASRVEGAIGRGDIDEAVKSLERLESVLARQSELVAEFKDKLSAYPLETYLEARFGSVFVEACKERGLEIQGAFPRFEVFPFRVRIIPDTRSVEVDERKVRVYRPKALAEYLAKRRARLEAASFNARRFVDALASVYDLIVLAREAHAGAKIASGIDIPLMSVYNGLTPLPGQRSGYPIGMFAFDLHRLFVADVFEASDGRRLSFGDTRARSQRIVTYDAVGKEHRFGSLRFDSPTKE